MSNTGTGTKHFTLGVYISTGDKSDVSNTGTGTKHFTLGELVPVIKVMSNTGTGTKHFTLGVPVPVIKVIMCRIPVPGSSFPTLNYRVG